MKKQGKLCLKLVICGLLVAVLIGCAANMTNAQTFNKTSNRIAQAQLLTMQVARSAGAGKAASVCFLGFCFPSSSSSSASSVAATATPTPTLAASGGSGYSDSTDAAQAVFDLINQERASQGLAALQWSNALANSAHLHNVAMFQANSLSHQVSGEDSLGTRISAQGVQWRSVGENIGEGTGDATQVATELNKEMFAETAPNDGHRQNILSSSFNNVGIDVIVNTQTSEVWLTEDFAQV